LTHVLFVDDVFLFRKGSIKEANILKEVLYICGMTTRIEITIHKYYISFNGLSDPLLASILSPLLLQYGIVVSSPDFSGRENPCKYNAKFASIFLNLVSLIIC